MLQFLIKPLLSVGAKLAGDWSARKSVAAASKVKVAEKRVDLQVAKIEAKIRQTQVEMSRDADYDMQVLKNRQGSYADEFIIVTWFVVFLAHFMPYLQPYMKSGWAAMGYTTGPAWWFEFGMVGILVSTLGLMRVLRLMLGKMKKDKG
jgi:hypothetical protein